MRHSVFLTLLSISSLLLSCSTKKKEILTSEQPQYFRIVDTLGVRKAEVYDPFHAGQVLARYYLVEKTTPEDFTMPKDGVVLTVPLQEIATTSATHIGFLKALDRLDIITAMATPHLIYNRPKQAVVDIGEDINLQVERVLLAHPQALFISAYGQNLRGIDQIETAGIPIVYLTEWREENPLARMEWLRFVGALTGTETRADSLVNSIRCAYHEERDRAKTIENRRSIMSGASFRGTWYVPSGTTYMGQLFRDAGAEYAFAERQSDGSIPLNTEQALQTFRNADVWVGTNAWTLEELRTLDHKQTWLRAYQTGEVYNFYRRQNSTGGNDFWETGVVHPEYILRDLRYALYPETMPDYTPYFLRPLQ